MFYSVCDWVCIVDIIDFFIIWQKTVIICLHKMYVINYDGLRALPGTTVTVTTDAVMAFYNVMKEFQRSFKSSLTLQLSACFEYGKSQV